MFKLEQDFWCAADGGGHIDESDTFMVPTTCTNSTHAIKREVIVTPTIGRPDLTIYMDLWLNVKSLETGLSNSENFNYALTTNSNSCTEGVIASGNFNGKAVGDQVLLLDKKAYSISTPQKYYLYIWLDAAETSTSTMDQSFSLSLGGNCFDDLETSSGMSMPSLDEGMIPITISEDGTVTTIKSDDSGWYNYDNKEWANVVLVDNDSRSSYKNTTGVTVDQDDILAYYVWIPRYKYKIWTTTSSSAGSEQTIDIEFESQNAEMSLGTQVDEWRTHPAFWWDDDSDGTVDSGETIAGIWVGKFETTGDSTTPTILPNTSSLRYQKVSTITSQKFSANGNIYGLSNMSTNAHMMKNSEWGAVAYLSHSKYGINGEIRKNNNSNYTTGCGASTENGAKTSECEISYNAVSTPQSTTGNITGIYDMSGGTLEYVMGYYSGANSNYVTDPDAYFGWTSSENRAGFTSLLESKYWDEYITIDSLTACNGGLCYGHALSETAKWYSNIDTFVTDYSPWFIRGNNFSSSNAGVFSSGASSGIGSLLYGFRSSVIVGFGA